MPPKGVKGWPGAYRQLLPEEAKAEFDELKAGFGKIQNRWHKTKNDANAAAVNGEIAKAEALLRKAGIDPELSIAENRTRMRNREPVDRFVDDAEMAANDAGGDAAMEPAGGGDAAMEPAGGLLDEYGSLLDSDSGSDAPSDGEGSESGAADGAADEPSDGEGSGSGAAASGVADSAVAVSALNTPDCPAPGLWLDYRHRLCDDAFLSFPGQIGEYKDLKLPGVPIALDKIKLLLDDKALNGKKIWQTLDCDAHRVEFVCNWFWKIYWRGVWTNGEIALRNALRDMNVCDYAQRICLREEWIEASAEVMKFWQWQQVQLTNLQDRLYNLKGRKERLEFITPEKLDLRLGLR